MNLTPTAALRPEDWLAVLRSEYLEGFLPHGGAAVKFAVPLDAEAPDALLALLRGEAEGAGYQFCAVDAAATRVNLVDHLFFAVARQTDWPALAYAFLRRILSEEYQLPERREDFSLTAIADLNGFEVAQMRVLARQRLDRALGRDYAMLQEFRIAMDWLCQAQLNPGADHAGVADLLTGWLRGDLKTIPAPLRQAGIVRRIGRHNGRAMLTSLAHWLHLAGRAGLALAVDIAAFLGAKRAVAGGLYYSKPAILDGYEVLRQFVDGVDDMTFLLMAVVAPPGFLDPDDERGVKAYDALRLRIWDDVRDPRRPNPLAPLVRLAAQAAPVSFDAGAAP